MAKTLYLGSDHAGFELKEKIKVWLKTQKIPFQDLGNQIFDKNDDYPDYAEKVSLAVVKNSSLGLLLCGSAEGMCIAANKVKGIRAVAPATPQLTQLARQHNDVNILCLSGWYTPLPQAKKMLQVFLKTSFSKEPRHLRRLNKIKKLEG